MAIVDVRLGNSLVKQPTIDQISDETWYAVLTGQGDIKNVIKRGGHRACFHATMLTNTVV